ncbi:hypothetical protein HY571_00520 [Candidatus Micrarchaeota archaeon]|nr:hypothetical protein [Candidatus Micrarchaeota archaeon]
MFEKGIIGRVKTKRNIPGSLIVNIKFFPGRRVQTVLLPNRMFIPITGSQRRAVESLSKVSREGRAKVDIHPEEKRIYWVSFYPFGHSQIQRRRGIGTRIHRAVVEYLAKRFKGYRITHDYVFPERAKQLAAMGIKENTDYGIEDYLARVRRYAESKAREGK